MGVGTEDWAAVGVDWGAGIAVAGTAVAVGAGVGVGAGRGVADGGTGVAVAALPPHAAIANAATTPKAKASKGNRGLIGPPSLTGPSALLKTGVHCLALTRNGSEHGAL